MAQIASESGPSDAGVGSADAGGAPARHHEGDELGFDDVVVTDALYMRGIAAQYSMPEAGVLAILAGNDFLMGPWWPSQMAAMIGALKGALASGRLSMARIGQSVRRILELKLRLGLLPQTLGTGPTDVQVAQVAIPSLVALVPTTRRRGLAQARRA